MHPRRVVAQERPLHGRVPCRPPTVADPTAVGPSCLQVLHVSANGEPALTVCSGGHTGATAQAMHAGREASLRRQARGRFCSRSSREAAALGDGGCSPGCWRLQPWVMEAVALGDGGFSPVCWRLQPCVLEAAALCVGGCSPV